MDSSQFQTPPQISPQPPIQPITNPPGPTVTGSPPAASPVSYPQGEVQPPPPKNNKSPFLILLSLIFLILLAAALIYLANSKPPKPSDTDDEATLPTASPTEVVSQEEEEVQSIDVGDIDEELKDIQTDLEQL